MLRERGMVVTLTMPSFVKYAAGGCGSPTSHAARNSAVCLLSGRPRLISPLATRCVHPIHRPLVSVLGAGNCNRSRAPVGAQAGGGRA